MTHDNEIMMMTCAIEDLTKYLLQLRASYLGEVERVEASLAAYRQRLSEFTTTGDDVGETQHSA